jgi:hypothetical protein
LRHLIAAAVLAVALPGAASALTFDGSWNVSGDALTDPGLVIKTSPASGSFSFDLDDGESTSFKLFNIWTDEGNVGDDDWAANDIFANFTVNGASGSLAGTVEGHKAFVFPVFFPAWGSVDWANPLELNVGTGILSVALTGVEHFNKGLFSGLNRGEAHGGKVHAEFSYRETSPAPAPVPLPAGFGLIAAGIGALGLFGFRRKA